MVDVMSGFLSFHEGGGLVIPLIPPFIVASNDIAMFSYDNLLCTSIVIVSVVVENVSHTMGSGSKAQNTFVYDCACVILYIARLSNLSNRTHKKKIHYFDMVI